MIFYILVIVECKCYSYIKTHRQSIYITNVISNLSILHKFCMHREGLSVQIFIK